MDARFMRAKVVAIPMICLVIYLSTLIGTPVNNMGEVKDILHNETVASIEIPYHIGESVEIPEGGTVIEDKSLDYTEDVNEDFDIISVNKDEFNGIDLDIGMLKHMEVTGEKLNGKEVVFVDGDLSKLTELKLRMAAKQGRQDVIENIITDILDKKEQGKKIF